MPASPPTPERGPSLERAVDALIAAFAAAAPFSIVLAQGFGVLAVLGWVASRLRRRTPAVASAARAAAPPLALPLLAFAAASVLSALAADHVGAALYQLKSEWLPIALFWICVERLRPASKAARFARLAVAAGALSALYALTQTLRHGAEYRVHGTLGHYMTLSGVLLLLGLFALALLLFGARGRRDAPLALALLPLAAAALMTQTRSLWLGFAVGAVPLFWLFDKRTLLVLPLAVVAVLMFAPEPVRQRAFSFADLADITVNERVYMWVGGLHVVAAHPLTGAGPGQLDRVYPEHRDPRDEKEFTHLHNNFVQMAAERGLLGLATWVWIFAAFLVHAVRSWRRTPPGDARALLGGALAAVLGFLVAGTFECNYRDSEVAQLLFFAMALGYCAQPEEA